MKNLILSEPNKIYEKSFKDYAQSYKDINDDHYFHKYKKSLENFDEYLNDLCDHANGINLLKDEVTTSTFWMIFGNQVVGVVRIRHKEVDCAGHIGYDISPCYRNNGYGYEILRLALEKAKNIGIREAILTCNVDNISSKKIIEKNNGKLLGTIFDKDENQYLFKYSIMIE